MAIPTLNETNKGIITNKYNPDLWLCVPATVTGLDPFYVCMDYSPKAEIKDVGVVHMGKAEATCLKEEWPEPEVHNKIIIDGITWELETDPESASALEWRLTLVRDSTLGF